jgi:hypothetical protein
MGPTRMQRRSIELKEESVVRDRRFANEGTERSMSEVLRDKRSMPEVLRDPDR